MTIQHPTDERLVFSVIRHENSLQNIRGLDGMTHQNPASHLNLEINGASWYDGENVVDITDFVNEYASHLFPLWEKQLAENEN